MDGWHEIGGASGLRLETCHLPMVYHLCPATQVEWSFCSFPWALETPESWVLLGSHSYLNGSFPKLWQSLKSSLSPSFPTLALPEVAAGWTSEKTSVVSLLPCFQVSGASCCWQNQAKVFRSWHTRLLTMDPLPPFLFSHNSLVLVSWQASHYALVACPEACFLPSWNAGRLRGRGWISPSWCPSSLEGKLAFREHTGRSSSFPRGEGECQVSPFPVSETCFDRRKDLSEEGA